MVHGGEGKGKAVLRDTRRLNLNAMMWEAEVKNTASPALSNHQAAVFGQDMYLYTPADGRIYAQKQYETAGRYVDCICNLKSALEHRL